MTPIGGVGINLAIQDAVAAANMLVPKILRGDLRGDDLEAVQRRREPAARRTQALQLFIQRNFIGRALTHGRPRFLHRLPALLRFLPFLPRIPGYLVGLGFRPEHLYEKTMPAS
jgi:2-polyprenyl-6-methoxyphenol hydroxylase-like FAD-dependent oxidoreductase